MFLVLKRLADGSSSLHDTGLDFLLLSPHCFNHVTSSLALELLIPIPLANPFHVLHHEWIEDLLFVPISGRLWWPVLETRLDALSKFQLPLMVLRFRRHCHANWNGRDSLFLFRKWTASYVLQFL